MRPRRPPTQRAPLSPERAREVKESFMAVLPTIAPDQSMRHPIRPPRQPLGNPLTIHVDALDRVADGIKTVAQDICGSNHAALREHWQELQRIIRLARSGQR